MPKEPQELNIYISPDGREVSYVHEDLSIAHELGPKISDRVSNVDLDEVTDEWVGRLMDGREICRHPTRAGCIALERQIIDRMKDAGEILPGQREVKLTTHD